MSYKTELMEQVLISPEGQRIIQFISPVYGESYTVLWLLQVIGMQLDKTKQWSDEFLYQVTPQTATWSLSFWEDEYGIIPESWWSIEQRRKNIVNQMNYYLPANPKRLRDIASNAAGVPVDIIENTGKNRFDVLVREQSKKIQRAIEEIDKYKPAHMIFIIRVAKVIKSTIESFIGVRQVMHKKYYVKVAQYGDVE